MTGWTLVIFVLSCIFLAVVVPVWIVFHYITRWKSMKGLTVEDERMLADLWDSAGRMEARIETLEKVLERDHKTRRDI